MNEESDIEEPVSPPPPTTGQKRFMAVLGAGLIAMMAAGAIYFYRIGAFSERLSYDQSWAYCGPGESCTAIRAPCDTWIAVNDRDLNKAKAYYDHMIGLVEASPQMECANGPHDDTQPRAMCMSGLCITAR